jgi:hypothetical protein
MPDEFFDALAHQRPPEKPVGPTGGRPRAGHRTAIRAIGFGLATGARREDVPLELGGSGRTAHRRLRHREEAGVRDRLHADRLRLLKKDGKLRGISLKASMDRIPVPGCQAPQGARIMGLGPFRPRGSGTPRRRRGAAGATRPLSFWRWDLR